MFGMTQPGHCHCDRPSQYVTCALEVMLRFTPQACLSENRQEGARQFGEMRTEAWFFKSEALSLAELAAPLAESSAESATSPTDGGGAAPEVGRPTYTCGTECRHTVALEVAGASAVISHRTTTSRDVDAHDWRQQSRRHAPLTHHFRTHRAK